jgi:polygalacturonase
MYLFSYFKKDREELFIADSMDGYHWRNRNEGRPLLRSTVGTGAIRDPFLYEDGQGWFHAVWTDGWNSRSIGYARSRDLEQWVDMRLIPLMEHMPDTQNCWAPEVYYDSERRCHRIIWSSTVEQGPRNHRIWSVTTEDFVSFSDASLFFDPGYNVIDATVVDLGSEYYMLYKDERGENEKSTSNKAIRSCRFPKDGSEQASTMDISELLTPSLTEGPTLYKIEREGRQEWIMLVDGFRERYYGAYRSMDLKAWEDVGDKMNLPAGARHGAVMYSERVLASVDLPDIPDVRYRLTDYGAVGDGTFLNTDAFRAAMAACVEAGGGVVVVPAGVWLTGPIRLRSKVNLHVEAGALVLFSRNYDDYPLVMTSYEGTETFRCQSPLYGENIENVAISGEGVFDGAGEAWRPVKRRKVTEAHWDELVRTGGAVDELRQMWWPTREALMGSKVDRSELDMSSEASFRPYKNFFRPTLLSLRKSRRILIDGPSFQNSAAWCLHTWDCEQMTIRRIHVRNPWNAQNGDGLDLESCRDVLVEDSVFDVGDDAMCLKSGKNEAGRRLGKPTERIRIRGCKVLHAHGGFVVGSEMSGGVRDVVVSDCTFVGTDAGLRFKSLRGRGGTVENIKIERIRMSAIEREAIVFELFYGKQAQDAETAVVPATEETPVFRNIVIRDVVCSGAEWAMRLKGLPEMPLRGINLRDSAISARRGISGANVADMKLERLTLHVGEGPHAEWRGCSNVTWDGELVDGDEARVFNVELEAP